jgi:mRNA interferase MazF
MSLNKGDIVLIPFPFTDLSSTKLRPAVVLFTDKKRNDVVVCFISSQNLINLSSDEFLISETDPEFRETGLKLISKVRVSRLVTINQSLITRKLGQLGINLTEKLNDCLKKTFIDSP